MTGATTTTAEHAVVTDKNGVARPMQLCSTSQVEVALALTRDHKSDTIFVNNVNTPITKM